MIPHTLINPWVGKDYEQDLVPADQRLLILGESMYGSNIDNYPPGELKRLIEETINGVWKKRNNFYKRVYRTVMDKRWNGSSPAERARFWDRIAFYNYVQKPVFGGARCRPSPDMWAESAPYFRALFEWFRPACTVVLGTTIWQHLFDAKVGRIAGPGKRELAVEAHRCPAVVINHPSYLALTADKRKQDRELLAQFREWLKLN